MRSFATFLFLILCGTGAIFRPQTASAQDNDGLFQPVPNPITIGAKNQIQASIDKARSDPKRNIKKVIFDFNLEGKEASTDSYGSAYEFAEYIRSLNNLGINTIAFVHGKTTGHTVLPVIACDDLVMSSNAQIGEVSSKEKPVNRDQTAKYLELAGITRAAAVHKMIDKDVAIVQGLYKGAPIYVDLRKVEGPNKDKAYDDVKIVNRNPVPLSAGVELYNVENARKFGLCKLQKENRQELAEWYQISATALQGDPLGGAVPKPCRINLEGVIDMAMREKLRRQIEGAKARKENIFFFVLTCENGDATVARDIADTILGLGNDTNYRARTIAFVPGMARNLAIFPALACQELVMFQGGVADSEASLGDFDNFFNTNRKANPRFIRENLIQIAKDHELSPLIVEGLFEKNLTILNVRNEKSNERRLMSDAELKQQPPDSGWRAESTVKNNGELLKLNASRAKALRIAKTINNTDVNEVFSMYGFESKDVRQAEPSWLDTAAAFLRRTEVSILLVIVAIAGLVLELKAPGLIIPGIISAICFVLFFWSQTQLGGQLIYLAMMLFALGIILLAIEIFVLPGFGVTGVSGILLILGSLVLAGVDRAPESASDWVDIVSQLLKYGLVMVAAVAFAFILGRSLPKMPFANRLILTPPEDKIESDELAGNSDALALLGQVGTTLSLLRPAGLAKFGERFIDVVTEGDFIDPGIAIQVIEVEGTRVVVKRV
jgi:membrane-bound serine protease (ClpP class)